MENSLVDIAYASRKLKSTAIKISLKINENTTKVNGTRRQWCRPATKRVVSIWKRREI